MSADLYGIKKKDLNREDVIYMVAAILVELSKIVVSSLLAVFVPQNCDGYTCTIHDNFVDLTDLNKGALGWNFITLGFMIALYTIIYKREKYLIYRLDDDPSVAKLHIHEVFKSNPEIESGVYMHNTRLKWFGIITSIIYLINVILSGVLIFGDYYDGYQSVIQFIVNAGLCYYILFRSVYHAITTERSGLVISNTHFAPLVYNQIDKDYKDQLTNTHIYV